VGRRRWAAAVSRHSRSCVGGGNLPRRRQRIIYQEMGGGAAVADDGGRGEGEEAREGGEARQDPRQLEEVAKRTSSNTVDANFGDLLSL